MKSTQEKLLSDFLGLDVVHVGKGYVITADGVRWTIHLTPSQEPIDRLTADLKKVELFSKS